MQRQFIAQTFFSATKILTMYEDEILAFSVPKTISLQSCGLQMDKEQ